MSTAELRVMSHENKMSLHDFIPEDDIVEELQLLANCMSTHKALADKIGISPSFLHDILAGKRSPGKKVCAFLKIEPVRVYREVEK